MITRLQPPLSLPHCGRHGGSGLAGGGGGTGNLPGTLICPSPVTGPMFSFPVLPLGEIAVGIIPRTNGSLAGTVFWLVTVRVVSYVVWLIFHAVSRRW